MSDRDIVVGVGKRNWGDWGNGEDLYDPVIFFRDPRTGEYKHRRMSGWKAPRGSVISQMELFLGTYGFGLFHTRVNFFTKNGSQESTYLFQLRTKNGFLQERWTEEFSWRFEQGFQRAEYSKIEELLHA